MDHNDNVANDEFELYLDANVSDEEAAIIIGAAKAFVNQPDNDEGDAAGLEALDKRLEVLLKACRLEVRRCFAHVSRQPNSRGGGYRGGKGSLCRRLLNAGLSKKQMKKVIGKVLSIVISDIFFLNILSCSSLLKIMGIVYMMSYITPGDIETFHHAVGLLVKKHPNINDKVLNDYFSSPLKLGGRCAGPAGTMGSSQGCERQGGSHKNEHRNMLKNDFHRNANQQSKNPVRMLEASSRYADYHLYPLEKFATTPTKIRGACLPEVLKELRKLANYQPPRANTRNPLLCRNFPSKWIYSVCKVDEKEMPLHKVLGISASFDLYFPTDSRQLTSLSLMLRNQASELSGAPGGLDPLYGLMDTERDFRDKNKLRVVTTKLPVEGRHGQRQLKNMIRSKLKDHTVEPKDDEDELMYLHRVVNRDAADDAYTEQPKVSKKAGLKSKSKFKTPEEMCKEQLEKDKNAGEKEDNGPSVIKPPANPKFQCKFVDEEEAIMSAVEDSIHELSEDMDLTEETFADRIRPRRELGDFIRTTITPNGVKCNCEKYNYWGDCPHCIAVEILHFKKDPSGCLAGEQWNKQREKILSNFENYCNI